MCVCVCVVVVDVVMSYHRFGNTLLIFAKLCIEVVEVSQVVLAP